MTSFHSETSWRHGQKAKPLKSNGLETFGAMETCSLTHTCVCARLRACAYEYHPSIIPKVSKPSSFNGLPVEGFGDMERSIAARRETSRVKHFRDRLRARYGTGRGAPGILAVEQGSNLC